MHQGCSGGEMSGKASVDKLRMMGFSEGALPIPVELQCSCGESILMDTFEFKCPHCNMVYGVTPCSSHDPSRIKAAGIDY
ncbi:MAG: hypothetical protein ACRDBX_03635 [Erysipelotrichaceae bacterium]